MKQKTSVKAEVSDVVGELNVNGRYTEKTFLLHSRRY